MDILTRIQYESKVVPGAVATFRRASAATRAVFLRSQAQHRAEIREIVRERKPLDDAWSEVLKKARAQAKVEVDRLMTEDAALTRQDAEARVKVSDYLDFPDDQFVERAESLDRQEVIERDGMGWSTLRSMLVSIDGYTIDGRVPGADLLIAEAPMELTDELVRVANEIAGLGATERGESPWPGISAKAEAGPKSNSTVPPVEGEPAAA